MEMAHIVSAAVVISGITLFICGSHFRCEVSMCSAVVRFSIGVDLTETVMKLFCL